VRNPQKEVERLCAFLDVEFESGMLLPENRHRRYEGQEAHSNLYNPISDNSVGKYRVVLDNETRRNYETQAREALVTFGYENGDIGIPSTAI
jgi:hypothetical protein